MIRRILLCSLCLALLPLAAGAARVDDQQAQLEKLRGRIAKLTQSIESTQNKRDALARDLQQAERRVAEANRGLKQLKSQLSEQQQQIAATQAQQTDAQAALSQGLESLSQQIRAAYVVGGRGQAQMLLNQTDVQKVGRMLVYYDYFQQAQTRALNTIQQRIDELAALAEQLTAEQDRLNALRTRQQDTLDELEDSRNERKKQLAALKSRINDERGELKRAQAEEKSVQELIERLQETLSDLPPDTSFSNEPFSRLKGRLPWPVRGKLIASYGDTKAGGKLNWKGHWIATAEGAPVHAVARGRVVYVGWLHRYGLVVLVQHEGQYYSLYGHAQSANAAVGDDVRAGQVIAAAGLTGGHEQPGVYFELRKGSEPINPAQWLAR